jgi:hypothetical protein
MSQYRKPLICSPRASSSSPSPKSSSSSPSSKSNSPTSQPSPKFVSLALLKHQQKVEEEKQRLIREELEAKRRAEQLELEEKALKQRLELEEKKRRQLAHRPSHAADRAVKQCFISYSVTRDTQYNREILGDTWEVKITNNEILDEILANLPKEPKVGDKFLILVDNSRYEIQVIRDDHLKTSFFQHFLHFEKDKLVSVNHRQVIIYWKNILE